MKNVVLYLKMDDTPYHAHDNILRYLYAQIDNSLHYGYNPEDLIVVTNFNFEYRGIKNTFPKRLCDFNVWANKFYVCKDLLAQYHDDIWLHDYDVWQIDHFEYPEFIGEFAGCPYSKKNTNWNGGSFFFNKRAQNTLDFICEFYETNRDQISKLDDGRGPKWYSDEQIVGYLQKTLPTFKASCTTLTPQYNLGMTLFEDRYDCAIKPIKAIHVKLLHEKDRNKFLGLCENKVLIPTHLHDIIDKYKL